MNRFLSYEAMTVVQAGGGYNSIPTEWSASEALPWLLADFANDPAYKTLIDGMHSLPVALADAIGKLGAAPRMGHRLVALRTPTQTGSGLHELVFETAAGRRMVRAERVILALPKRSLELIPEARALRDPSLTPALNAVTSRALGKAFIAHAESYWRRFGLTSGKLTTDLPARQIYYFGTEPSRPATPSAYLTMAYFDGEAMDFWDGKRRLEQPGARGFVRLAKDGPFAREMQRQIAHTHGLDAEPKALSAAYMNWGDDPYGGGWHSWNQGEKSWEVMPKVVNPFPRDRLHIVGEAWSTDQGWIEGALRTAEDLLGRVMRVPKPNWL